MFVSFPSRVKVARISLRTAPDFEVALPVMVRCSPGRYSPFSRFVVKVMSHSRVKL